MNAGCDLARDSSKRSAGLRRSRRPAPSLGGPLLAALLAVASGSSALAQTVVVNVTLVQVTAIDDYDDGSEADHYAIVAVPGETRRTSTIEARDSVGSEAEPAWTVSFEVTPTGDPLPMRIELWDDDFFTDDEHIHIGIEDGRNLLVGVDLAACQLPADINPPPREPLNEFRCGQTILSAGTATNRASLRFRLDLEFPPSTPGTNAQHLHFPIRPIPGDTVTIFAQMLDGALSPNFGTVEIFTGGQATPAVSGGSVGRSHSLVARFVKSPGEVTGGNRSLRETPRGTS